MAASILPLPSILPEAPRSTQSPQKTQKFRDIMSGVRRQKITETISPRHATWRGGNRKNPSARDLYWNSSLRPLHLVSLRLCDLRVERISRETRQTLPINAMYGRPKIRVVSKNGDPFGNPLDSTQGEIPRPGIRSGGEPQDAKPQTNNRTECPGPIASPSRAAIKTKASNQSIVTNATRQQSDTSGGAPSTIGRRAVSSRRQPDLNRRVAATIPPNIAQAASGPRTGENSII